MASRAEHAEDEQGTDTSGLDEPTLVSRAQDGDTESFDQLMSRYEGRLFRYAYGLVGNRQDAEDVLQESWIRVWRALPSLGASAAFGGWTYRIVTHQCMNLLKRLGSRRTDPIDAHQLPESGPGQLSGRPTTGPDPETAAQTRLQLEDLVQQLHRLPPEQRACWLLREVHEHSYREIGLALSVPESTVRGRLAQARGNLAKGMSSWQ